MPHYGTQHFSERFRKRYGKLETALQRQVDKTVIRLIENPFHPALQAHSIKSAKFYWEAYINAGWRLIYRTEGDELFVVDVVAHDDIGSYDHRKPVR
jgi:mRNA-degrading endonuclease YafQ of YafQ-DinJ toxin-antitoxin module